MGGKNSKKSYDYTSDEEEEMRNVQTPLMECYSPQKNELIRNMDGVFKISDDPTSEGIERYENYGIIPLNIIHTIMLFQSPTELLSMSLTCRLFYTSQNCSHFWKTYFNCYFKNHPMNESDGNESELNWKMKFFKRFYLFDDSFYIKKYKIVGRKGFGRNSDNETISSARDFEAEGIEIPEYKICLMGATCTGKTSVMIRVFMGPYKESIGATIGAGLFTVTYLYESRKRTSEKCYAKIAVWDTAGMDRYKSLVPMYYRGSSGLIVFFSFDSLSSFETAKKWVKEVRGFRDGSYVETSLLKANITLVGNKDDLEEKDREVDFVKHVRPFLNEHKQLKKKESKITRGDIYYCVCSAKENYGISKVLGVTLDGCISNSLVRKKKKSSGK